MNEKETNELKLKLINDFSLSELEKMVQNENIQKIRRSYKNAKRKSLCIRMNETLYNKICNFCNKKEEYSSVKAQSTLSGFCETVAELFLANENLHAQYFNIYNQNIPKQELNSKVGNKRSNKKT